MAIGPHRLEYEVLEGWEQLPEGWSFVEVAGVAVDSRDRVYVFNRGAHPMIVFDKDGRFLDAWGEGVFTSAHGIFIDQHDHVYCADNFDHTVRKFTTDGELLMTLGDPARPADTGFKVGESPALHSAGPFNMVTATPASTASPPTASSWRPGASPAPGPASSTCRTRSQSTAAAGCWSPTARTRASRSFRGMATFCRAGTG